MFIFNDHVVEHAFIVRAKSTFLMGQARPQSEFVASDGLASCPLRQILDVK